MLSSIWVATIACFAEASWLLRKITSNGLAGFSWRRAFPVPVLMLVTEVMVLRDTELELVMMLGARLLE